MKPSQEEVLANIDKMIELLQTEIGLLQKLKLGIAQHYAKLLKEKQHGHEKTNQ